MQRPLLLAVTPQPAQYLQADPLYQAFEQSLNSAPDHFTKILKGSCLKGCLSRTLYDGSEMQLPRLSFTIYQTYKESSLNSDYFAANADAALRYIPDKFSFVTGLSGKFGLKIESNCDHTLDSATRMFDNASLLFLVQKDMLKDPLFDVKGIAQAFYAITTPEGEFTFRWRIRKKK